MPQGQGSAGKNGYLFSGELVGWRKPKILHQLVNSAARYAYRIPIQSQTQAVAYLVFLTNPLPDDTFVVGEDTYTWRSTLVPGAIGDETINGQPYDVLIGATPAASAINALAALTLDNTVGSNAGVLYGSNTVENGDILIYAPGEIPLAGLPAPSTGVANVGGTNYSYVSIGSQDFGAAYNTIGVSESTNGTRTIFLRDLLSLADTTTTFTGGINPSISPLVTGPSTWLEFLDQDTSICKSQVVDDQYGRYYISSPSAMPTYNTYDRITAGLPAWLLGVPNPGCSPGVSVTGGGNSLRLGYTTGSGIVSGVANQIYLIPITPSGATQIQDVQVMSSVNDPNCQIAAVIYEDNGNNFPGELLNTGQIVTGITAGSAAESIFVNPSDLIALSQYWIGFITNAAENWTAAAPAGSNNMATFPEAFSNGPPATAPASASTNQPAINMWADLLTTDVQESRAYVYTWMTQYGEEGPPSPATLVDGWSNGTWTIDPLFTPVADDMGIVRNIQYLNLYRTVPGTSGSTVFFYLCTIRFSDWAFSLTGFQGPWYSGNNNLGSPTVTVNGNAVNGLNSSTASFTDTLPDNYVSLNDQLPSTTWFAPPENLEGFINLPNGLMAGFKGNELWICNPYTPHAWPPSNVIVTDFPIVGLGQTAGAIVVCTDGYPYVVTGNVPGQMPAYKCTIPNPCISKGSILSGDSGVIYMSPNGLIAVNNTGQATNTTELWFTREKWQQLTPQKYTRAMYLASSYFCYGTTSPSTVSPADNSVAQQGFTIELQQDNMSFSIWPTPGGHRLGFMPLDSHVFDPTTNLHQNIDNVMNDIWTGVGLLISDGYVWQYDFTDPTPLLTTYDYTSKIYQQNNKKNYSSARVFWTLPPNTPQQNEFPNEAPTDDPSWNTLQEGQYGILYMYADPNYTGVMELISAREIRRSGGILRFPQGYKAENFMWRVQGRVQISNIQIATSIKELANV